MDGHAGISRQGLYGSTARNTNTTSATILEAAPDAEARFAAEKRNKSVQLNAVKGPGKNARVGPVYNAGAGTDVLSADIKERQLSAGVAPTAMQINIDSAVLEPKGEDLHEGGFEESFPNESFRSDIGSKNDPASAAEKKTKSYNAQNVIDAGYERDLKISGISGYDVLGDEEG